MNEQRIDLLVSRAVDCVASSGEWDELAGIADVESALWKRVGLTLRDRAGFNRAVASAASIADGIELPKVTGTTRAPAVVRVPRRGWLAVRGGWAVAALVALAWGLSLVARPAAPPAPRGVPADELVAAGPSNFVERRPDKADLASWPADDLLAAYIDRGQRDNLVVGELPEKVLVRSRNAPSGDGFEVLFVRPILERTVVPNLYEFSGRDEAGRPTPVPVRYEPSGPPR